ncbi:hypothetical protein CLV30_102350 [Haloactinopolyspora alba]|uniref:Uncharacterized protein n=1 Tax=Haloactinopolyspora alba TaxID=648780 RepID=A0A2P8EBW9_9ACTN|nr:hypothetical protein [Haloactinopolyspora alba]PSL06961.1 hypothetical protein CLV30_102350 [Haloactinopolyspora alba]
MSDAAHSLASVSGGAGDVVRAGILDWASATAVDLRPVLQTVAITVAVLFVIYKAVQSKFSLGTIVVSALAAGVFVWVVFNVNTLSDTIGEDLPGDSPAVDDARGGASAG